MTSMTRTHEPLICLEGPEDCRRPVLLRWPGYGERDWPRCEHHGNARLAREEEASGRYPEHRPADFSELDAGEHWDEDDY